MADGIRTPDLTTATSITDFIVNETVSGTSRTRRIPFATAKNLLAPGVVTASVEVTVGSGGDYATINAAIAALTNERPKYAKGGIRANIRLLSSYVMAEQVLCAGIDLSWIRIYATGDTDIPITRSALTSQIDTQARYPAFGATDGGFLPVIAARFTMDTSGTATGRDGVYCSVGSRAIIEEGNSSTGVLYGVKNAGGDGCSAQRQSFIVAHVTNFSGAGENALHAGRTSRIDAALSTLSNSGTGIYCWRGSTVDAYSGPTISGCTNYAVYAHHGGKVSVLNANCQNAGIHGIYALGAVIVSAPGANCSNAGTDGVRAQAGAVVNFASGTATGCGGRGIYALYGATVSAQSATLTGNTTNGVYALGATVDIISANAQMGASTASTDIAVAQGGVIRAANSTGGTSVTTNAVSANGIIFK